MASEGVKLLLDVGNYQASHNRKKYTEQVWSVNYRPKSRKPWFL